MFKSAGPNAITELVKLVKQAIAQNKVTASVSKVGATAKITISDADGTTEATISDGATPKLIREKVNMSGDGQEVAVPSSIAAIPGYASSLNVYYYGILMRSGDNYTLNEDANKLTLTFTATAGDEFEFIATA